MASETSQKNLLPPKSMTVEEVHEVARELQTWVGSQFQEVMIDGVKGEEPRSLRLGFFWTGGVRWIVFDYRIQAPLLVLFDGQDGVPMVPPKTAGKIRRPIELFLRSKHVGRRLREVRFRADEGRAIDLVLDPNEDGLEVAIELKVYPHGRNARAVSGSQAITEFKPLEMRVQSFTEAPREARTSAQLAKEWLRFVKPSATNLVQTGAAATSQVQRSPLDVKIEKRGKALKKVQEEILSKEQSPARSIGEWIKENQSLDVPRDWPAAWKDLVDSSKSLAANIEKLFSLAKSQTRKLDGTRERARELEKEIEALEKKRSRGEINEDRRDDGVRDGGNAGLKDLFVAAEARGRKFQLSDDLIVYLGKNAAENLAILRKAQPFDYWLHLKDRPSAHAILRRPRGRNITDLEFIRAGTYVAEQTMKRRAIELKGESFDLLIVECRFVRPIKGDRMGRVHYTNDRVLRLTL